MAVTNNVDTSYIIVYAHSATALEARGAIAIMTQVTS